MDDVMIMLRCCVLLCSLVFACVRDLGDLVVAFAC
jgi:hypothetical protein